MNPRCREDSIQRRYAMRMTKTDIFPALNMDRRKRIVFQVRIQHHQFSLNSVPARQPQHARFLTSQWSGPFHHHTAWHTSYFDPRIPSPTPPATVLMWLRRPEVPYCMRVLYGATPGSKTVLATGTRQIGQSALQHTLTLWCLAATAKRLLAILVRRLQITSCNWSNPISDPTCHCSANTIVRSTPSKLFQVSPAELVNGAPSGLRPASQRFNFACVCTVPAAPSAWSLRSFMYQFHAISHSVIVARVPASGCRPHVAPQLIFELVHHRVADREARRVQENPHVIDFRCFWDNPWQTHSSAWRHVYYSEPGMLHPAAAARCSGLSWQNKQMIGCHNTNISGHQQYQ